MNNQMISYVRERLCSSKLDQIKKQAILSAVLGDFQVDVDSMQASLADDSFDVFELLLQQSTYLQAPSNRKAIHSDIISILESMSASELCVLTPETIGYLNAYLLFYNELKARCKHADDSSVDVFADRKPYCECGTIYSKELSDLFESRGLVATAMKPNNFIKADEPNPVIQSLLAQ